MSKIVAVLAAVLCFSVAASVSTSGEVREATVEQGLSLFKDPSLGTKGRSCNDCHREGKGLERAGARPDLPEIVNRCISGALKGKELPSGSVEMRSILLYLKGLGKGGARTGNVIGC